MFEKSKEKRALKGLHKEMAKRMKINSSFRKTHPDIFPKKYVSSLKCDI